LQYAALPQIDQLQAFITAIHYNLLQYTTTLCSTLQHTVTYCNTLQHTAAHCSTHTGSPAAHTQAIRHEALPKIDQLQAFIATIHCNSLQHTATHCNTLQHTHRLFNVKQYRKLISYKLPALQVTATNCNLLQQTATHCNTLQLTAATHCITLQHTATHIQALEHGVLPQIDQLQASITETNMLNDYKQSLAAMIDGLKPSNLNSQT